MNYKTIVCGGTFDLLHIGHMNFLQQVSKNAEKVIIGLTSDLYTSKYKIDVFEKFEIRQKNLKSFLVEKKLLETTEIVSIDDVYGPLLDKDFIADAIAVTEQTRDGALQINTKRAEIGLPQLEILTYQMDLAEDGTLISSTRIRNGEIDRRGKLYINPNWIGKTFKLPEDLRAELHKPFGKMINGFPKNLNPQRLITIGDITTQKFILNKVEPFISVIDFVVERHHKFDKISDLGFDQGLNIIQIDNPAGQITSELFNAISNSLKANKNEIILVNGEEDLAVLPVLLSSPLGFVIYYGQPKVGLVEITVTEEIKERGYQLLSKFDY